MLKVKINGKSYGAEKGEYVLEVCRRNHILVPTLCHHESLPGLGACRLCVVEVNEGNGNRLVVSCVYPLNRDCEVFTESDKVNGIRKTILSMLKAKAPAGDRLASLCQIYGVESDPERFTVSKTGKGGVRTKSSRTFSSEEKQLEEACVLCGLCVQTCASLSTAAISTVGRGVTKMISTPYGESSADCIGCGSCAAVCPTKAIECTEDKGYRSIWGRKFKLLRCASCGRAFATKEEYALALEKAGADTPDTETQTMTASGDILCDTCRKKKSADVFAAAFGVRVS